MSFIKQYKMLSEMSDERYANSPTKQRFARKCMVVAQEWLIHTPLQPGGFQTIYGALHNGPVTGLSEKTRGRLYQMCRKYVKDNVDITEERQIYGSILVSWLIGAIISWIVKRLLDIWFPK